jgi:ribosomal-protein-alanine N-acetyltransferase
VSGTDIHIPTLETGRLRLRAPKASDLDAYAAFRASERARVLGGPYTRAQAFEQLGELIGHWHLRGFGRWMVADLASDAPLGVVGLFFPEDWPEPEIAWSLFEAAEGRGIAQEAAMAARDYAYSTLGWTTVVSLVAPDNVRSVALARRLGAQIEGRHPHPRFGALDIWRHPARAAA